MKSNRVVPLSAECEVVGIETARAYGASDAAQSAVGGPRSAVPSTDLEVWEIDGQLIEDDREVVIKAGDFSFALPTRSFFQVNRHLLATMLSRVQDLAEESPRKKSAIDLYAGVGFFTAPLARAFERVTAVEGSAISSKWGRRNATRNVRIVTYAVEDYVERMPRADLIFLDPPRSGVRKNVIERIAERAGSVICFLACDPVTFSRDASRLIASGWHLSTLDLLDLFPNTHHVETLASFRREA